MMDLTVNPLILAGTALAVTMGAVLAAEGERADRRSKQLATAASLLGMHLTAVEEFCDSPEAPVALQRIILDVSDALEDREFATRIFSEFHGRMAGRSASLNKSAQIEELEALRRASPETAALFSAALTSGMFSAFLHWPECAEGLEDSLQFLVDPQEQLSWVGALASLRSSTRFDGWSAQPV